MNDTSIMKLQKLDYIIRRVYVVALIIGGILPIFVDTAITFDELVNRKCSLSMEETLEKNRKKSGKPCIKFAFL